MADLKQKFGSSNQALTITVASLTNSSLRQSAVVDNSSNLFFDAIVSVKLKTNSSGTSSIGYCNVYAYATADGGTTYTGGASGSDAAYTADSTNLVLLGIVTMTANSTTYTGTFNLSRAFGYGGIPEKWGIVIENGTGATLDSTGGNPAILYQGIYAQSV